MEPFIGCLPHASPHRICQHVLVLVCGAILSPLQRTVAAALRVVGLDQTPHFTNYYRVLNRNQWNSHQISRRWLHLLVDTFNPTGPVIIGIDDTIERRWGACEHLGSWHLPRPGPLLPRPLGESERSALAGDNAAGRDNVAGVPATRSEGGTVHIFSARSGREAPDPDCIFAGRLPFRRRTTTN